MMMMLLMTRRNSMVDAIRSGRHRQRSCDDSTSINQAIGQKGTGTGPNPRGLSSRSGSSRKKGLLFASVYQKGKGRGRRSSGWAKGTWWFVGRDPWWLSRLGMDKKLVHHAVSLPRQETRTRRNDHTLGLGACSGKRQRWVARVLHFFPSGRLLLQAVPPAQRRNRAGSRA